MKSPDKVGWKTGPLYLRFTSNRGARGWTPSVWISSRGNRPRCLPGLFLIGQTTQLKANLSAKVACLHCSWRVKAAGSSAGRTDLTTPPIPALGLASPPPRSGQASHEWTDITPMPCCLGWTPEMSLPTPTRIFFCHEGPTTSLVSSCPHPKGGESFRNKLLPSAVSWTPLKSIACQDAR